MGCACVVCVVRVCVVPCKLALPARPEFTHHDLTVPNVGSVAVFLSVGLSVCRSVFLSSCCCVPCRSVLCVSLCLFVSACRCACVLVSTAAHASIWPTSGRRREYTGKTIRS